MGKSADLYELCPICKGDGITGTGDPNFFKYARGFPVCVACDGNRYSPIGLNRAQVDAMHRKAGEYDALKARIAQLEALVGDLLDNSRMDSAPNWRTDKEHDILCRIHALGLPIPEILDFSPDQRLSILPGDVNDGD